jgi:N,N'-diacetyllegionaminate synthase
MYKIIAETAFSHEGDFSYLLNQIEEASKAKVDYVKFQVFINLDQYIVPKHPAYDIVKDWIFSEAQWKSAFKTAKEKGLKVLALPLNVSSLELCISLDYMVDIYEIHPVCFHDIHLINLFKKVNKKILIGVGGALINEVKKLISVIEKSKDKVILMHGFQSFPTDANKLNLGKIKTFKDNFQCEIGYADHSGYADEKYKDLNSFALFLGATYFEKHIVLEKGKNRIDYETALVSPDFIEMRDSLDVTVGVFGNKSGSYLNDKEIAYKKREKLPVYNKDLKQGEVVTLKDFCYKITEVDETYQKIKSNDITGKVLNVDIIENQIVLKSNFVI